MSFHPCRESVGDGREGRAPARALHRPTADRARRHGRDLPGDRHDARPRRGDQGARRALRRGRRPCASASRARRSPRPGSPGNPNIVTIYDVGEHDGRPFIVMEYLAGGSLEEKLRGRRRRCRRGRRSSGSSRPRARSTPRIGRASSIATSSRRTCCSTGNGRVHVADFGIASAAGLDSLTQTGTVLGTASYLSPEQAQGRAHDACERSLLARGRRVRAADRPAAVRRRQRRRRGGSARHRAGAVGAATSTRERRASSTPCSRGRSRRIRRSATRAAPSSSPRCARRSSTPPGADDAIVAVAARASAPPRRGRAGSCRVARGARARRHRRRRCRRAARGGDSQGAARRRAASVSVQDRDAAGHDAS